MGFQSKEELYYELQRKTAQLNAQQEYLRTLQQKLQALDDFNRESQPYIDAFEESIQRRTAKLQSLANLEGRALVAKGYMECMSGALTGRDYQSVVSSIGEMQGAVSIQRQKVIREIDEAENRVRTLCAQVEALRYQYNTYSEADDNGS